VTELIERFVAHSPALVAAARRGLAQIEAIDEEPAGFTPRSVRAPRNSSLP
jgi:hypothetical protein